MFFKNPDNRPPLERAIELARRDETVKAEELLVAAIHSAERRHGAGSAEAASARNDLAILLMNLGQARRAAEALRSACDGPRPSSRSALKDRLTYEMNLGYALEASGDLDGAEQAFRNGLDGRADYYGREHPGYAFGLEPLAALLVRRGKAIDALPLFEEAVQNFWRSDHPRLAGALALRAEALKAAGDPTPPFAGLDGLSDSTAGNLVHAVLERSNEAPADAYRRVLADLLEFVESRFSDDSAPALQTLAAVVEHERRQGDAGDADRRIQAVRRVLAILDRQGRAEEALSAVMGLALALDEARRFEEAGAAQREAITRAERIGKPDLLAQALRNAGLFYAEIDQAETAEPLLRRAIAAAQSGKDPLMLGRAEIALGIFLQHGSRLDEARPILQSAVRRMEASHPDAVTARSHLTAIERGESCGCGDREASLAAAFREFVLERLPSDLLQDLEVTIEDGDFRIGVKLQRKPSKEELESFDRTLQHALAEFRRKLSERLSSN